MTDDDRILQLLEQMLDSHAAPDQVCADCPELLPAVTERWKRLQRVDAQVEAMFPSSQFLPANGSTKPPLLAVGLPVIAGYQVQGILGRGGIGVVYRARHLRLDRPVALKMLLSGAYAGPNELARFIREARIIAALHHPNLVQIHDVDDVDGCPFFTMELLEGGSLAGQLKGVPQPPNRAAELVATLAVAVQFAHDGGIVHRDLKPANILFTADGTARISDFGLARRFDTAPDVTRTGDRVGTPSYMAPEQVTNRIGEVGPPADLYSLGAVLYEMLTGRPPFRADTASDTERQLITDEPARPSRLNTKIPRDLETICLKCLQKDPRRRYPSASAMAMDLRRFLAGEPITARPVGAIERTAKWVRRRPALATTLAATFVLALVITGGTVWLAAESSARTRGVEADLQAVAAFESDGRWDDARVALARAQAELGGHGSACLHRRLDLSSRDLEFVARFEAIQYDEMGISIVGKKNEAEARYVAAFREFGIEPYAVDKSAAVSLIQRSPVRIALIETLDQWVMATDTEDHCCWLLEVAREADADQTPWMRSARDPQNWKSREKFAAVVAAAPISSRSISLVYALASHDHASFDESPITLLTRIQQSYPGDIRVSMALGKAYFTLKNQGEAIRYFQAAVSAVPHEAVAEGSLGAMLFMTGYRDEALVHFEQAVRLQPSIPRFRISYATALATVGRRQEAIEQLRIGIAQSPKEATLYANLGWQFDGLPDRKQAVDAYRTSLQLDPNQSFPDAGGRPMMRPIWAWEQLWPGLRKTADEKPSPLIDWPTLLPLDLFLDHEDVYRAQRATFLQHMRGIKDPARTGNCTLACLLLPASEDEARKAAALFDFAVGPDLSKLTPDQADDLQVTRALIQLRLGHPQNAVDLLNAQPSTATEPLPQLILSIAQQQLGHADSARKSLDAAVRMVNWDRNRATDSQAWALHILRQEAERQLRDVPATLPATLPAGLPQHE